MIKFQKGTIKLFRIALVIAIGFGVLFYFSSWKTYTNDLLNYSVKYPRGWEVHSVYPDDIYPDGSKVDTSNTPYIGIYSKNYKYNIRINPENYMFVDESGKKTFEKNAYEWRLYYMVSTAELGNAKIGEMKEEDFILSGRTGIKVTIHYQFEDMDKEGIAIWIYVPLTEDKLLSIKYESQEADFKELEVYDKILSTFEFH